MRDFVFSLHTDDPGLDARSHVTDYGGYEPVVLTSRDVDIANGELVNLAPIRWPRCERIGSVTEVSHIGVGDGSPRLFASRALNGRLGVHPGITPYTETKAIGFELFAPKVRPREGLTSGEVESALYLGGARVCGFRGDDKGEKQTVLGLDTVHGLELYVAPSEWVAAALHRFGPPVNLKPESKP